MKTKTIIKECFDRKVKILERKPSIAKGSVTSSATVKDGTTCVFEEGPWKFTVDMSDKAGGNNEGPTPGTFGRAALASCLAISYMMYASKMEIPIVNLEVVLDVDYDARGMYGFDEVRAGYTEARYTVKIESPATEENIMAFLDKADKHSSYLDIFANPMPIKRTVEITKTV